MYIFKKKIYKYDINYCNHKPINSTQQKLKIYIINIVIKMEYEAFFYQDNINKNNL